MICHITESMMRVRTWGGALIPLMCLCFLVSCSSGVPSKSELLSIEERAEPVIAWLESEKVKNGRYPQNLSGKYRLMVERIPYPAEYLAAKDGSSYCISVGDYSWRFPFTYHRGSGPDGAWRMDM